MTELDDKLRALIRAGRFMITADDVTDAGAYAVDASHQANGRQSSIGSHFRRWAADGLIERTGGNVRSTAPRRRGGMIQVWLVTAKGKRWAESDA